MNIEKTPEWQLQRWFEGKAEVQELRGCIENIEEIKKAVESFKNSARYTEKFSLSALRRALRICDFLDAAELLSKNRSVAPAGSNQMRPDVVLFTDSAHYILVELKTQSGPERQGVQELLAYSTAMKMQMPFVNDFVYIIVAEQWDDLLWFGVRSLIMDGKYVLPLRWTKVVLDGPGRDEKRFAFSLHVVSELFDIDLTQHFQPLHALVPHTLAVERVQRKLWAIGPLENSRNWMDRYFIGLAKAAAADCEKLFQTGFALIWSNDTGHESEIMSLTLATISQHWMLSEDAPTELQNREYGKKGGVEKLILDEVKRAKKLLLEGRDDTDLLEQAFANEDRSRFYPRNDFSFDVIDRHRVKTLERDMYERGEALGIFEWGAPLNVFVFLQSLTKHCNISTGRLRYFVAFGELAEFILTSASGRTGYPKTLWDFHDLMYEFENFKQAQTPARHS